MLFRSKAVTPTSCRYIPVPMARNMCLFVTGYRMVTQNKQAQAKETHGGRQQNESCEWRSSIGAMHKAV